MSKRKPLHKTHTSLKKPPFECVALLLQGGGALGAYQAGVYEALSEANLCPDWIAGISIGALNSAIIAGNAPGERVQKLREFWESITSTNMWDGLYNFVPKQEQGDFAHNILNQVSSGVSMLTGVPGFFKPRIPMPWFAEPGSLAATSYYDTEILKTTLENFIDFDRINSGETCLSVGAVDVRSGNFVYFDTHTHTIRPEHIMASGALPPAFPAVEIDGEFYWDGGLVSNTPLQWVVDNKKRQDTLAFQVDLWSAEGDLPHTMAEVGTRQKEIMYSSRTRAATDRFKHSQRMRHTFSDLYKQLPPALKKTPEARMLEESADHKVYNIIHLIYRSRAYEGDAKDYEFSRQSMEEHWTAGYNSTVRTLRHPEVLERPTNHEGVFTFDVNRE